MYLSSDDGRLAHPTVQLRWTNSQVQPSWNTVSNVLYLDQPAGTGYSYSGDGNITTDDEQTAQENYYAIQDFFMRKFPEYLSNRLYIYLVKVMALSLQLIQPFM